MVIEMNKDIEKYQESVVWGLTGKQLLFSALSLLAGGGIVLLTYQTVGLTTAAYLAIPVAAPIALGGFYSYYGMSFYEVTRRRIRQLFFNRTLLYRSSEQNETESRKKKKRQKKREGVKHEIIYR